MFSRTLRYFASLLFEPIIQTALYLYCRMHRYDNIRIRNWHFSGPKNFIQLINEAAKRLELQNQDFLAGITTSYTIIYSYQRGFSFPEWKYSGMPDNYISWGVEGVIAGWVYCAYHFKFVIKKGRWYVLSSENAATGCRKARWQTKEWLVLHHFPKEIIDTFDDDAKIGGL